MLIDLDVLDCPICYEPLTIPTFQCDIGHVACKFCWPKLKRCPLCALPIGNKRCIAVESALERRIVPCRNSKLGCTKNVPYGRDSTHEKEYCRFSLCSCPEIDECKYTGSYKDLLFHYLTSHMLKPNCFFTFGESRNVRMNINDKVLVLVTLRKTLLFTVQCFRETNGVYVAVNCIAPLAPEIVEKFSYRISYSFNGETHSHEVAEMKRILGVSFQIPQEKNLMFVSNSFLSGEVLEMELCISEVESRMNI
ncbi:E3 ubiquitin-protein ligase SINA-like 7 [Cardamine amara subsp. amara]|uniref:RING-type E3 ubiquitin transferase n=1 Tax=Cardamine amara subsp. amara TaxID=228776 RepID=A0ABD1C9C1_CARAN